MSVVSADADPDAEAEPRPSASEAQERTAPAKPQGIKPPAEQSKITIIGAFVGLTQFGLQSKLVLGRSRFRNAPEKCVVRSPPDDQRPSLVLVSQPGKNSHLNPSCVRERWISTVGVFADSQKIEP